MVLALAFGFGIWIQQVSNASVLLWVGGVLAMIVVALAYHLASRRRLVSLRAMCWTLTALIAFCSAGAIRLAAWNTLPSTAIGRAAALSEEAWESREEVSVTLEGRVVSPPIHSPYGTRFVVEATELFDERGSSRPSASGTSNDDEQPNGPTAFHPVTGRVQVSFLPPREDDQPHSPHPRIARGDRILIQGILRTPPKPRNPGDADYGAYLQRQGIQAMLRVYPGNRVRVLATPAAPTTVLVNNARRHIKRSLALFVRAPESRAVLAALLLADRSTIDASTRDAFADTGLMHLLAVSGLHVMLLGWIFYTLLHPLLGRLGFSFRPASLLRVVLTLALLGFYVLLTESRAPVVRAFVMTAVFIGGQALQRRSDALNAMAGAALILLAIRPAALFDVGFQLSFSAVAALITLTPVIESWLPAWDGFGGWTRKSVIASTAATLGTAPVLLVHFGKLPLAGILLNIPAIPLTAVALGAGFATSVLTAVFPTLASGFGALADLAARALLWISSSGAQWMDWSLINVSPATLSSITLLVMILGLITLALWKRPRLRVRTLLGMLGVLALGAWTNTVTHDASHSLDVVFLDVGHGDAAVIRTPNDQTVLIDAGNETPYWDHGASTVLPALQALGIQRLDAVILSHADADHAGGIPAVLQNIEVGRIISNGQSATDGPTVEITRIADSLEIPQRHVRIGDTLQIDPAVRFRVLGPTRPPGPFDDPNEASVVLRLEHGEQRFLFLGDAERLAEANLVEHMEPVLTADVVKVGHHGSRTSSSPALVAATGNPSFAVVSVDSRSRFGLPDKEPLQRWRNTGAEVLTTAENGAVWLRSDGAKTWRVGWK